jgi:hypothetical protein
VDSKILTISMVVALLSTPEQLKCNNKGTNIVLNKLLQLVIDAAKGTRYRSDGFHVTEPIGILVKMFVVEERTVDYVLCHAETEPPHDMISTIDLFVSLLLKFSDASSGTNRPQQFTVVAVLNILWSISFTTNYAQELVKNQAFIDKINTIAVDLDGHEISEQYKPRSMEGIKQAAHEILLNLNIDKRKHSAPSDDQHAVNDARVLNQLET